MSEYKGNAGEAAFTFYAGVFVLVLYLILAAILFSSCAGVSVRSAGFNPNYKKYDLLICLPACLELDIMNRKYMGIGPYYNQEKERFGLIYFGDRY